LKNSIFRFLIFFLILSWIAFSLSSYRAQDQGYIFAETGNFESVPKQNLILGYMIFIKQLFWDWGGTTISGELVVPFLAERLIPTLALSTFALLFAILFGIFGAVLLASYQSNFSILIFRRFAELILATPIFIIGVMLLLVFFYQLEWLPPGGFSSPLHLILPGITLGSRIAARLFLFTSKEIEKERNSEYVFVLESRGMSEKFIFWRAILPKLQPLLSVMVLLELAGLLSGAMVVEELFFYPGIGKALYYSIRSMDLNLLAVSICYSGCVFYFLMEMGRYWNNRILGEGIEAHN